METEILTLAMISTTILGAMALMKVGTHASGR